MRPELRFLHFRHDPHCTATVDKHFIGYATLQLMTRGQLDLRYDDTRHLLDGGWYWPAFPGPHIQFRAAGPAGWWEHRYVAFQGPLLEHWISSGLLPTGPVRSPSVEKDAQRFDQLHATLRENRRWSHLSAINQLEQILIDLAESQEPTSAHWLKRAMSILTAAPEQPLEYEAVAAQLDIGFSTFRRQFKLQTGQTPHEYRLSARIGLARDLLGRTETPIKEIAAQLGYADVFYFSRHFRQATGLPPKAYRESVQR